MNRQIFTRHDPKRRAVVDPRKKQFVDPTYQENTYPSRLNFYSVPPTADITLEQFEQWAIDRLRVLAELEACAFRNRSAEETATYMKPILEKYLPLSANSSARAGQTEQSVRLQEQRQKDHYSHFILRLAFASTEDLRRRFARVETALFRMRLQSDDTSERAAFVQSLSLDWEQVTEKERKMLREELAATSGGGYGVKIQPEEETWCKVDWDRVPELVERRVVFLRGGKAYVPGREQQSMVITEFSKALEKSLEVSSTTLYVQAFVPD
jgi:DNA primase large subunit